MRVKTHSNSLPYPSHVRTGFSCAAAPRFSSPITFTSGPPLFGSIWAPGGRFQRPCLGWFSNKGKSYTEPEWSLVCCCARSGYVLMISRSRNSTPVVRCSITRWEHNMAPQAIIHRNYTDYGAAGENFGGFVHYFNVSRDKNDVFSWLKLLRDARTSTKFLPNPYVRSKFKQNLLCP